MDQKSYPDIFLVEYRLYDIYPDIFLSESCEIKCSDPGLILSLFHSIIDELFLHMVGSIRPSL